MTKSTFTPEQKKAYFADKRAKFLAACTEWKDKLDKSFVCYNAFTQKPYSGNNHCYLAYQGGSAGAYAGFAQWRAKGYQVRKGEHGKTIVQPIVKTTENKDTKVKESEIVSVSFTTVFHFSQVESKVPLQQTTLELATV